MKFNTTDCYKHTNCMDAFFFVNCVLKEEDGKADLLGHWLTQGIDHYWLVSEQETIHVNETNYEKWKEYEPKGVFV